MKFLADLGLSPKTVAFLHALGYDAVHLSEQGLERLADPEIVAEGRQEGRIMLVHDLDFSGSWLPPVEPGCPATGIIVGVTEPLGSGPAEETSRTIWPVSLRA